MSEEMKSAPTQEAQENVAKNSQNDSSNDGLIQEIMAKKSKIKEQNDVIAQYQAKEKKRAEAEMEEQGKLKELINELKLGREKDGLELADLRELKNNVKSEIVNYLTSDDEKKEMLMTKDLDTLQFLKTEKASINNSVVENPTESLGAVRSKQLSEVEINNMTPDEKRKNWPEITEFYKSQN